MRKLRWVLPILVTGCLSITLFASIPSARAFTATDADTAMTAYINALYDANAKYFYSSTDHSGYNDFWKEAISWDVVMDAYQRTNSSTYRQLIDDVYDGFMASNGDVSTACNTQDNFTLYNDYNDDIGWWAKGAIRAYELTGQQRYKNCAKRLFDAIYAYWDTGSYGGGIWWTRSSPVQKNVATNAPAAITAAKLSEALSDSSYLDKAKGIFAWVKNTLTDGSGYVYDDYDNGTLRTWQFTYNYGAYIGAAAAIYHATNDSSYLDAANQAATKSLTSVTNNGILQDEGNGDGGGFKGVYARYLAELVTRYNQNQYLDFLQWNATTAWNNRNSSNLVGTSWTTVAGFPVDTHAAGSAVAILQVTPPGEGSGGSNNSNTYQAENGTLHNVGTESIYSGYHGSGYIAGWNSDGQWVDFSVNVPSSGSYRVTLRYAAGAGDASRYIYVNGAGVVDNLNISNTGSWSNYATVTISDVQLNTGGNTISVIYNSSKGSHNWINLDEITLVAQ